MTIKLNGCPRCNGTLDLNNQDPTCFTCGWADYTYADKHKDRATEAKGKRSRSSRSLLPYRGLMPHRGPDTLVIVLKEGRINEIPICYSCTCPMVPAWIPGTKVTEKGFVCDMGHTVKLLKNERGEVVGWL
jgi:hypothetical protein